MSLIVVVSTKVGTVDNVLVLIIPPTNYAYKLKKYMRARDVNTPKGI